ncbi:MAG TPA: SDR family NAD(P)-dependent oxidoreductase, partial [Anaerolineae bacterium]
MLTGKVALVTGAGRGLGKAIALRLGREGAKVAVNDLNPENAETTAAEIVTAGGEAGAWVADVGGKRPIQNMIDEVQERWGRIDILINTARVEPRASIMRMDEWDWERTIGVNLKGTFLMCQSVGRVMKESGGAIVNVVSDTADGSD